MEDDLIKKIKNIVSIKTNIDEDNIRSLMIIIRKLLDKMKQSDQNLFLTLRLFCNWSAHTEITNSNTGLRILAEINDTLVSIKYCTDIVEIQTKMSNAIGFSVLRKELNNFFLHFTIDNILVIDNQIWAIFITNLIEIIRDVPLSFPNLSKLDESKQKIYNKIAKNPIKPGAGVISIKISKIDNTPFGMKEKGEIMCLIIRTEDTTTTTIIPLLIDVRL